MPRRAGLNNESLAWIDAGKKASAASRFCNARGGLFAGKSRPGPKGRGGGRGILNFFMIFSSSPARQCGF
jgi:hypothetical protein